MWDSDETQAMHTDTEVDATATASRRQQLCFQNPITLPLAKMSNASNCCDFLQECTSTTNSAKCRSTKATAAAKPLAKASFQRQKSFLSSTPTFTTDVSQLSFNAAATFDFNGGTTTTGIKRAAGKQLMMQHSSQKPRLDAADPDKNAKKLTKSAVETQQQDQLQQQTVASINTPERRQSNDKVQSDADHNIITKHPLQSKSATAPTAATSSTAISNARTMNTPAHNLSAAYTSPSPTTTATVPPTGHTHRGTFLNKKSAPRLDVDISKQCEVASAKMQAVVAQVRQLESNVTDFHRHHSVAVHEVASATFQYVLRCC